MQCSNTLLIVSYLNLTSDRDLEKRLLAKGLNIPLPPIKLNYGDYITPLEPFYRKIRKLPTEDHELEKVKTEIKRKCIHCLIIIIFGMNLISAKKSSWH